MQLKYKSFTYVLITLKLFNKNIYITTFDNDEML